MKSIIHEYTKYKKLLKHNPENNIYRYKVNKYFYYLQKGGTNKDIEDLINEQFSNDTKLSEEEQKVLDDISEEDLDNISEDAIEKDLEQYIEDDNKTEDERILEEQKKKYETQGKDKDEFLIEYNGQEISDDITKEIEEDLEKHFKCDVDCKEYTDDVKRKAIEYLIEQLKDIKNKLEEIVRINAQQ